MSYASSQSRRLGTFQAARNILNESKLQFPKSPLGSRRKQLDVQDIIATLNEEHEYLLGLLDFLHIEAQKLKPGKIPDFGLLLDVVHYLCHYPQQYHHPREDALYGFLESRDSTFKADAARLAREHETLELYNDKLFESLTRVERGRPANRPALLNEIERYIDNYRQHLVFESDEIFPLAAGTLSAEELAELSHQTRLIDDPLFGDSARFRYRRLARRIGLEAGILGSSLQAAEMSAFEALIKGATRSEERLGSIGSALLANTKDLLTEQWEECRTRLPFLEGERRPGNLGIALSKNCIDYLVKNYQDVVASLKQQPPPGATETANEARQTRLTDGEDD